MISIEFAHIYLDEYLSQEQIDGKKVLIKYIKESCQNTGYEVTTLIDDYNALSNNLNLDDYKKFLNFGLKNNVKVLFESDMIPYTSLTLGYLSKDDAKSYKRYIDKFNRYPCSLLAMTFYLIRLGVIECPDSTLMTHRADKLLNILSDRFEEVENLIVKRLTRSKLSGIEKKIETLYIRSGNELFKPNS